MSKNFPRQVQFITMKTIPVPLLWQDINVTMSSVNDCLLNFLFLQNQLLMFYRLFFLFKFLESFSLFIMSEMGLFTLFHFVIIIYIYIFKIYSCKYLKCWRTNQVLQIIASLYYRHWFKMRLCRFIDHSNHK